MPDEPSEIDIRDRVHAALCEALAGTAMVTRWVALVEVIEQDGQRAVWSLAAEDMKPWDTLGLLKFGEQIEAAETLAQRIAADDDD